MEKLLFKFGVVIGFVGLAFNRLLIMEMTNEFMLLLPLMIVSIMAYAVPEFAHNKPIYDELLDLDLARRRAAASGPSSDADTGEESPETGLIDW